MLLFSKWQASHQGQTCYPYSHVLSPVSLSVLIRNYLLWWRDGRPYQKYIVDKGRVWLDETILAIVTDTLITEGHTWRDYCLNLLSYLHIGDNIVKPRDDGGGTEVKEKGLIFACGVCRVKYLPISKIASIFNRNDIPFLRKETLLILRWFRSSKLNSILRILHDNLRRCTIRRHGSFG